MALQHIFLMAVLEGLVSLLLPTLCIALALFVSGALGAATHAVLHVRTYWLVWHGVRLLRSRNSFV
jgi:hypothetical protein